jgi:hypothetical protein
MIEDLLEFASDVEPESHQRLTGDQWEYRLRLARFLAQQHLVATRRKAAEIRDKKRVATDDYIQVGDIVFFKPSLKLLRKQKLEPFAKEKFTVSAIQGNQVTLTRLDGSTRVANVQDLEVFAERQPQIVDVYEWVQQLARQKLLDKPSSVFSDSMFDESYEDAEPDEPDHATQNGGEMQEVSVENSPRVGQRVADRVIDYYRNHKGQEWVQIGYAGRPTQYSAHSWMEIPSPEAAALPNLMDWLKEYRRKKVYGPYTQDLIDEKSVTAKEKKQRRDDTRAKRDEKEEARVQKSLQRLRADSIRRRR